MFGHPLAHENDGQRAVVAGLDITREVTVLSDKVRQRFGFDIDVRVGVHRGVVYLDTEQDDVYGLGANLAARMCSLAAPGERRGVGHHRPHRQRPFRTRQVSPQNP